MDTASKYNQCVVVGSNQCSVTDPVEHFVVVGSGSLK